jgi:hypothetical protein
MILTGGSSVLPLVPGRHWGENHLPPDFLSSPRSYQGGSICRARASRCRPRTYNDRIDFWTIDGNTIRWLRVVLFAVGGALRLWPVYVLGNRFSGLVTIGHAGAFRLEGCQGGPPASRCRSPTSSPRALRCPFDDIEGQCGAARAPTGVNREAR